MKIKEYKISAPHVFSHGPQDTITLPQDSFVQPIDLSYVPKHIIDKSEHSTFNANTHTYAYTRYGILPIPKSLIREA